MPRPSQGVIGIALLATRLVQVACLLVTIALAAKSTSSAIEAQHGPASQIIGMLCIMCFAIVYCTVTLILYWDRQLPTMATAGIDGLFFVAMLTGSIILGKPLSYTSCSSLASGAPVEDTSIISPSFAPPAPAPPAPVPAPASTATRPLIPQFTQTAATIAATVLPGSAPVKVEGSDGNMYTISGRSLPIVRSKILSARDIFSPVTAPTNNNDPNAWISTASESQCNTLKAMWGLGIVLTVMFIFTGVMVAFMWRAERKPHVKKSVDEGA